MYNSLKFFGDCAIILPLFKGDILRITEVKSKSELKKFVYFPKTLYRDSPNWAPPIWSDEIKAYDPRRNPVLRNNDYSLILAYDDSGNLAGRNLIYIDGSFNSYYKSKTGFFGGFECVNSIEIAASLMEHTEKWLAERGMETIRGPIHPIAENWGFLAEGFEHPAIFMSPYNHPYYLDLFSKMKGYEKVKDLIAYMGDSRDGYMIPERIVEFSRRILEHRPNLTVRRLRANKIIEDGEHIWRITNESLSDNWGYVPLERDVFLDMVHKIGPIVDPDAIWFVEDKGTPVAYAFGFPDLNTVLRKIDGRLFPFGFLSVLFGIKLVRYFRLFGLAVMPGYKRMGLDVLLYINLYNALRPRGVKLEANYILEDNFSIRNALEKLNLAPIKKFRIFEKSILK